MVSITDVVAGYFNENPKAMTTILVTPSLIEPYAKLLANKTSFSKDELSVAMRDALAMETKDLSILKGPLVRIDLSNNLHKIDGSKWGLSRKDHQVKMTLVTKMRSIVVGADIKGISKTKIFKLMRKDNLYWRGTLAEWLDELVSDGMIKYSEKRYYSNNLRVETREQMIHRLVFESLEEGPLSMTGISKRLGYDGGDARAYIKNALDELSPRYIIQEGIRWRWAR